MATITYSTWTKGWTSFWSYVPDWMIGLNSSFYTFTEGKLYRHNDNTTRNNFYGVQYPSTVTTVFNDEPMQMKVFKTISEDSNKPWKATIDTELNTAEMDVSYFVEKEAEWFSYIRRVDNTIDLKAVGSIHLRRKSSKLRRHVSFDRMRSLRKHENTFVAGFS